VRRLGRGGPSVRFTTSGRKVAPRGGHGSSGGGSLGACRHLSRWSRRLDQQQLNRGGDNVEDEGCLRLGTPLDRLCGLLQYRGCCYWLLSGSQRGTLLAALSYGRGFARPLDERKQPVLVALRPAGAEVRSAVEGLD